MAQNFLSDIKLGDDIYIRLGDRNDSDYIGDFFAHHNGSHTFLDNVTGTLYFRNYSASGSGIIIRNVNTGDIQLDNEHAGNISFSTSNIERAIINSDGHFRPGADSTYDLGLDATRWRNVYADNYYGDGSNLTGVAADESRTIILTVKNKSGGSLSKGTLVHASPSATPPSGNIIEVVAAENDVEASMPALGVLNETLADEAEGECVVLGSISGISTTDDGTSTGTLFSIGDFLYVSDTAGLFTNVKPTGTKLIQKIGIVIKAHATNGTVEVFGAGRTNDVPTPLYIDHANQRVGIGATSPLDEVHISKSVNGDTTLQIENANAGTGARANLHLQSDASRLDIYATSSTYNGVASWVDAGVINAGTPSSGGLILNSQAGGIKFQTATNERMRLDSSGNLGLGSASPTSYNSRAQDLVIKKTGSNVGISIVAEASGGTNYSSSVVFADGTGGTAGYRGIIEYDHDDDSMAFSTAATETLSLNSDQSATFAGDVTITGDLQVNGTTTTVNQTNLDVSDNIIGLNRGLTGTNANDSGIIIERGSSGDNAAFVWDESIGYFSFGTTQKTPSATGAVANESDWTWKPIKASGAIFTGDVDFDGHITLTGSSKNIVLNYGNEIRTKDSGGTERTVLRAASDKLQYGWSFNGEVEFMGGGSYTPRITINTDGSTTFAGDVMPAAENAHNIGSASVRWEDLYVDDGYIRNAYIDEYVYHNGDTGTNARFQTNRLTLTSGGGAIVDLHSNGGLYFTGASTFYSAITVNGDYINIPVESTTNKYLYVAQDTDYGRAVIGRAFVGKLGWDDHAGFSHVDHNTQSNYALLQDSGGQTFINVPSTKTAYFRVNNATIGSYTSTGLRFSKFFDQSDTTYYLDPASTSTSLNVAGGGTFAGAVTINAVNDAYNFKAFGQDTDSWFGVYDDANNSANIILTRSDTAEMFKVMGHTGNATFAGHVEATEFNVADTGDYITLYGDNSANHSISSRNSLGNAADDIRINSYGAIYLNLDSNNNNTSGADFMIGRHGGAGTISDSLFTINGETGNATFEGDIIVQNGTSTHNSAIDIKGYEPRFYLTKTRGSSGDDIFRIAHENDASAVDFSLSQNGGSYVRTARITANNRWVIGGYDEVNSSQLSVQGNFGITGTATIEGGTLELGKADTASGHINAKEVMTFNIDTDNDDTNRYFAWYKDSSSGSGTELFKIEESGDATFAGNIAMSGSNPTISFTTDSGIINAATSSGVVVIKQNGNEKFRVDSAGADVTGDLSITGNLYVTGTSTAVNVEDLNVEQGEITLNYAASSDTSSSADGAGIRIQDAVDASTDATILWDQTNSEFDFSHGATFAGGVTVTGEIQAGIAGNSSANTPALRVYASGASTDTKAAIAIQQGTTEGDTIIFADYEPHVEWGISAQNSTDQIHFTAGSSTNSLGTKTFYNNSGSSRTAYIKFNHDLTDGTTLIGGNLTAKSIIKSGGTSSQYLMADGSVSTSATDNTKLPLAGGTLTGQVIFPSAATTKPVLPNGFISRDDNSDTSGRHDIWGISERYYPSNSTAADAWGIQWSGTPNDIVFVGGGTDRVTISLDEGNATFAGTISSKEISIKQQDDSGFDAGLTIERSANTQKVHIGMDGGAVNFNSPDGLSYKFRNNGTEKFTVDGSGNATFAGDVTANGDGSFGTVGATNNSSVKTFDGSIVTKVQSQTAGDTAGVLGTESNHTLKLVTNNTTALTIDTSQNATFAGDITAPGQYGESYSVDSTSGTTAIIDTVTLAAGDHHAVYEVVAVGNPNAAGSALYRDIIFGKIIVSHGYTNPNVLRYIHFVRESPLPRDMHTSGTSNNLTMEVVFWDGSSESETFTSNSGTPTIRVKIDGYNSSYVGSSTSVRLKRIM